MDKLRWQNCLLCWLLLLVLPVPLLRAQDGPPLLAKTALIDGVKIHYRVGGQGPALMLLHGFTLSGSEWEPFLNDLMQNFTVIVPDLPGHGRSEAPDGPFRFRKTAKIMFGLLDRLDIQQVRCIGHSAGGVTLLYMAHEQPKRVEAMALVGSAHRMSSQGRQLLQNERFETLDAETKSFYRNQHPGGDEQISRLFSQLHEITENSKEFIFSPKDLSAITTPTLLIWGDRDDYFPIDIAVELYQTLPDAQLWVVPGQGHTPIWTSMGGSADAAKRFPSVVTEFFNVNKGTDNSASQ